MEIARSCTGDDCEHLFDRAIQSREDRPRNHGMTDAQLVNLPDRCNRTGIDIVESMPPVYAEPQGCSEFCRPLNLNKPFLNFTFGFCICILTGMKLNHFCPRLPGGFDLVLGGIDKQTDGDSVPMKLSNDIPESGEIPADIQPPFRRQLLTMFGDQRHEIRLHIKSDLDDLVRCPHLQIELRLDGFAQKPYVAVLDVPAVFAQMADNPLSSRQLAQVRRGHRVGFPPSPRIADRRNVVYIDSQSHFI